jgi:sulfite reductase (NADPH) hemoprotein beta-component
LNRLYRQNVKIENFSDELRPLLERFKNERVGGEHFGDFAARAIL